MASQILNISIGKLVESPYQGRLLGKEHYTNVYTKKLLDELAESISNTGLMQPITVRAIDDKYEIIDGHRRVAAYKLLEKGNIPAIIKEGTEREIQTMSLVANIQRSDLSSLERALAFEKILKSGVFESKKELSKAIGKDETYVGDIMNLLKMDKRIIADLAENNTLNDVRILRMIRNTHKVDKDGISDKQHSLYLKCAKDKLSRAQISKLIKTENKPDEMPKFSLSYNNKGFYVKFNNMLPAGKKEKVLSLLEQKVNDILSEIEEK